MKLNGVQKKVAGFKSSLKWSKEVQESIKFKFQLALNKFEDSIKIENSILHASNLTK